MLATRIPDHVQQALDRFLEQYKGKEKLTALVTALVNQVQDLEDAIYSLDEGRQLYNGTIFPSMGVQLDGIGELVGISRNGLNDAEYLVLILGKIGENFSDSTIPAVFTIIETLYNAEETFVKECFPGGVAFELGNPQLPEDLWTIAKFLVQNSLGATIAIVYIGKYDPANVFKCSRVGGPMRGQGFGSLANPAAGGGFAGLIYSNPND